MIKRTLAAVSLAATFIAAAPAGENWSFTRQDRAAALDHLMDAIHRHSNSAAAEEMLIQLRANRPFFLNIGDRRHFASAIDHDMYAVDSRQLVLVRLTNDDGAGVDLGSGLYAVMH